MYLKYNLVLRGMTDPNPQGGMRKRFEALCQRNTYATSLHVINSAVVKLSNLQEKTKVYRGISGKMRCCLEEISPKEK